MVPAFRVSIRRSGRPGLPHRQAVRRRADLSDGLRCPTEAPGRKESPRHAHLGTLEGGHSAVYNASKRPVDRAPSLGTTPPTSGDRIVDNSAKVWTVRRYRGSVHTPLDLSPGPPHHPSTPRRRPGPGRTPVVHTIHTAYCYCCLSSSSRRKTEQEQGVWTLGTAGGHRRPGSTPAGRPGVTRPPATLYGGTPRQASTPRWAPIAPSTHACTLAARTSRLPAGADPTCSTGGNVR
jgi:hypothetical protein